MLKNSMDWIRSNWQLFALASLTLGLAPFVPEPHVWGKLKWLLGGAEGMKAMDWFDLLMHATPWVLFILSLILNLAYLARNK